MIKNVTIVHKLGVSSARVIVESNLLGGGYYMEFQITVLVIRQSPIQLLGTVCIFQHPVCFITRCFGLCVCHLVCNVLLLIYVYIK